MIDEASFRVILPLIALLGRKFSSKKLPHNIENDLSITGTMRVLSGETAPTKTSLGVLLPNTLLGMAAKEVIGYIYSFNDYPGIMINARLTEYMLLRMVIDEEFRKFVLTNEIHEIPNDDMIFLREMARVMNGEKNLFSVEHRRVLILSTFVQKAEREQKRVEKIKKEICKESQKEKSPSERTMKQKKVKGTTKQKKTKSQHEQSEERETTEQRTKRELHGEPVPA